MTLDNVILDVGSIGFGVQSTGILFAQAFEMLPRTDFNYFADLGRESQEVYDYMAYCIPKLEEYGIKVKIINSGDIYTDVLNWKSADRVSMIPVWFKGADGKRQPLNRQCTSDYKIVRIAQEIRTDLNIKRFKRWSIRVWQGISKDEEGRVKKTKLFPDDGLSYRINHYPFIEKYANITNPTFKHTDFTRTDVIDKIFVLNGLKIPPKSSCYFCPFHDIYYWLHIYTTQPQEWESACLLDESIRNYDFGMKSGPFYLYQGLIPLREIDFDKEIAKEKTGQLQLMGCSTGFCFT